MDDQKRPANRLKSETSPYLLQHAYNPVDWYPWGEEALEKAKQDNKPIFLSIGYSACHWCHVMEHESFESVEIADTLNRHFVSIKVDREERPDLDDIYMTAVQLISGSGGWPMTVFLTPDRRPFFGGTYFPPQTRYGRIGFGELLLKIQETWEEKQEGVLQDAENLTKAITAYSQRDVGEKQSLSPTLIDIAVEQLGAQFDARWGGFGHPPKFPPSAGLGLMMRRLHHTPDPRALHMLKHTLDRMAYGGMYDQFGGGFHRYSVDEKWLVPHFEKMLYDNALLARTYLDAWQLTKDGNYRRITRETLDYVLREMTDPTGGFHSSEDADSEGEEGTFYVWTPGEIAEVIGAETAERLCRVYDIADGGNFEGKSIPNCPQSPAEFAEEEGLDPEELQQTLLKAREALRQHRDARVHPGLDDKILTSWNGLMISAMSRAGFVLAEEKYLRAAEKAAEHLIGPFEEEGRLYRSFREGRFKQPGYLDDYAFLLNGLIDLFESTFDLRWLTRAEALAEAMMERFWEQEESSFYFTSSEHTDVLLRVRPVYDGAEPSGNSIAALALLRLAGFTEKSAWRDTAEQVLTRHA
ncbi:MAG: thioredoxin domain-containing protein, partial [Verrucomicrobiota bacterium]